MRSILGCLGVLLLGAWVSGCVQVPDKLFACEADGGCEQRNGVQYVCVSQVCQPPDGGPSRTDGGADGGRDGGPVVEPVDLALCSGAGWCKENPVALGRSLVALRGTSATDMWALGDNGLSLHWNGTAWVPVGLPSTAAPVNGVGFAGGAWWAVGAQGGLSRWSGTQWERVSSGVESDLYAVAGAPGDGGLIVGADGTLLVLDGGQWSGRAVPAVGGLPPTLRAAWAGGDGGAWVAGNNGALLRSEDGGWTQATNPASPKGLRGLSGVSESDLWAVGDQGALLWWNGTSWTLNTQGVSFEDVWASGPQEAWIVGPSGIHRAFGASVSPAYASASPLHAVWGSAPDNAWAVGGASTILHYDGQAWREGQGGWKETVDGLWSDGSGALWAVGDKFLALRQPAAQQWTPADAGFGNVSAISGSNGTVYVVGTSGAIYRYTGGAWIKDTSNTSLNLYGVSSTQANGTWVVGVDRTILLQTTPGNWVDMNNSILPATTDLRAVWAANAMNGDIWIVGESGAILHRTGTNTSDKSFDSYEISNTNSVVYNAVWSATGALVWAVGNGGVITHCNPTTHCAFATSPVLTNLYSVSGNSSGKAWAVGDNGTILAYDGTNWTQQSSGTSVTLRSVWATEEGVWAAGDEGTVLFHALP